MGDSREGEAEVVQQLHKASRGGPSRFRRMPCCSPHLLLPRLWSWPCPAACLAAGRVGVPPSLHLPAHTHAALAQRPPASHPPTAPSAGAAPLPAAPPEERRGEEPAAQEGDHPQDRHERDAGGRAAGRGAVGCGCAGCVQRLGGLRGGAVCGAHRRGAAQRVGGPACRCRAPGAGVQPCPAGFQLSRRPCVPAPLTNPALPPARSASTTRRCCRRTWTR